MRIGSGSLLIPLNALNCGEGVPQSLRLLFGKPAAIYDTTAKPVFPARVRAKQVPLIVPRRAKNLYLPNDLGK